MERLFIIRCSNPEYPRLAISVIDHRARITTALAPHTQGVAEGEVEGRVGLTPFARWAGHFGLWPAWLLALGVVALAFARRPRL